MSRPTDILVIGGGVIGCATALELAKSGLRVILVERGTPGCEASGASAGMLAPQAESSAPSPFLALARASQSLYPDLAVELHEETGVDIELQSSGNLVCFLDEGDEAVGRAAAAWQREAGLKAELLSREDALRLEPGLTPEVRGALFFAEDQWVNNVRLVAALAQAAASRGVEFLRGEVTKLVVSGDRAIGVKVGEEILAAGSVLLAAGAWSGRLVAPLGLTLPVEPVRGQMLSLSFTPRTLRHLLHVKEHYLVPRAGGEILVGASMERAGFSKQVTAGSISALLNSAIRLVPDLAEAPVTATWAGFRPGTPDERPILGPYPGVEGLSVATGHFRNGILLAPITARLMRELIVDGAPSLDLTPFLPDRFTSR
jgi:glycine oxidase